MIYHNNIVDATTPAYVYNCSQNSWDNGYPSGGNYWGNYVSVIDDRSGPYQDILGSDGIGDYPFDIAINNTDWFPLIGPASSFKTGTTDLTDISSNSTIINFSLAISDKRISFTVSGESGTNGYCRISVPKSLMYCDSPDQWIVKVDNIILDASHSFRFTHSEDDNFNYFYIVYSHSTHTVDLIGTHIIVVPEFSSMIVEMMALFVLAPFLVFARTTKRKAGEKG
jgi:hypothetical protein